jgi:hypothetical protein
MRTTTTTTLLCLGLCLAACSDPPVAADTEEPGSSDDTAGTEDPDPTEQTPTEPDETAGTDPDPTTGGTAADSGEPVDPGPSVEEACDAGHEAWVKRAIPLIQGRKPEGMREVLLLVSMIEQLDALGADGRAVVARGLASGDLYLHRWKIFLWEQLRINRIEVKSNFECYSQTTPAAADAELAAFIRDNDAAGTDFGAEFTLGDVLESSLRLDDLSPLYRADMFARMASPLGGANISQEEFEVNARSNFGEIFESAYLGRRSGCLECHNSEESVTYNPDPKYNHFWAIPGNFERALFGDPKGRDEAQIYAMFRWTGFVGEQDGVRPWGMSGECGRFRDDHSGDILADAGYLGGDLPASQQLFDIDPLFKSGFASLGADGLALGDDLSVAPDQALAYMTAVNITNNVWTELMGYPLTLAHSFPRNERQREILQTLAEAFVAEDFSLRTLVTEITLHPYFNADAPDVCGTSSPYFMQPVFDPFSITSSDPSRVGNGVGDRVQRYSAWVLVESAMRAMWWDLPVQQIPESMQNYPELAFLRDQGIFIKDAQNGFNGVDFNGMLSWEDSLATGYDPGLEGDCTGPLGQPCAMYEWIELMLTDAAGAGGVTIRDLAAAIKDRLITEPTIYDAELAVIAAIVGLDPAAKMNAVDSLQLEEGTRRYAGLIMNTPQFMLSGVPSRDQDPAQIPKFAAPGTDTESLCNHLAPLVLTDKYTFACTPEGVEVSR